MGDSTPQFLHFEHRHGVVALRGQLALAAFGGPRLMQLDEPVLYEDCQFVFTRRDPTGYNFICKDSQGNVRYRLGFRWDCRIRLDPQQGQFVYLEKTETDRLRRFLQGERISRVTFARVPKIMYEGVLSGRDGSSGAVVVSATDVALCPDDFQVGKWLVPFDIPQVEGPLSGGTYFIRAEILGNASWEGMTRYTHLRVTNDCSFPDFRQAVWDVQKAAAKIHRLLLGQP